MSKKKKKNSQNNIVNINSSNKKLKLETSFDENNLLVKDNTKDINNNKYISIQQNNTPIINKVFIFEIGKNKIFNNENNSNSNINNNLNNNNHSYKNIIRIDNSKTNKNILYNNDSTPKKNMLNDIIKKNIEYNKENKNFNMINNAKSMNN